MTRKVGPGREFLRGSHVCDLLFKREARQSLTTFWTHRATASRGDPQRSSTTSPWLKELQRKIEGGAKAQQEVHTRARRNLCPLQTSRTRTKTKTAEKQTTRNDANATGIQRAADEKLGQIFSEQRRTRRKSGGPVREFPPHSPKAEVKSATSHDLLDE